MHRCVHVLVVSKFVANLLTNLAVGVQDADFLKTSTTSLSLWLPLCPEITKSPSDCGNPLHQVTNHRGIHFYVPRLANAYEFSEMLGWWRHNQQMYDGYLLFASKMADYGIGT